MLRPEDTVSVRPNKLYNVQSIMHAVGKSGLDLRPQEVLIVLVTFSAYAIPEQRP
jgi:hypothetical protein